MNLFDMRTIVFSYLITNIICVWFVVQLWRQNRNRFAGTAFWVVDFIFQAVALFLIVMRGTIPDWTSMVLSNTLVIVGAILGFVGQERFVGKKGPQIHNVLLVILFIFVQGYFALVEPNLAVRNLNIATALLLVCFQYVWLMWHRVEPGRRSLTFGVGMVNLLYCLVSSVRIAHFFVAPHEDNNYFLPDLFEALMLLSYQVLFILLTYSFVLMVNKRLIMEVGTQEEKFSKAFHSAPYAIMITRPSDGKIIEVNEKFSAISGYGRNEVLENSSIALHLWERDEDRAAVVDELSKTGKVDGKEARFQGKNGEAIVGLFSAEILPIDGENFILSSIADITGRKQAEENLRSHRIELEMQNEELKQAHGELDISSAKYFDLYDLAPVGYFTLSEKGLIQEANLTAATLLGLSRGTLVKQLLTSYILPEDQDIHYRYNKLLLETGKPQVVEMRMLRHDSDTFWVRMEMTMSVDGEGSPVLRTVISDISEHKRSQEEKINLQERLQRAEKMEALGQLAGGVAHDLNNVLGILSGYSELLLEEIPEGNRSRGYVEKILQSTKKGAAIIDDLLTLARRGVSTSDVINLNSIVFDFLETPVFDKFKDYHPRVIFRTDCDKNLLNIKGSLVHLEKTLMNLVSNAAEAISGEGEVTIRTENRHLDKPIRGYDEVTEGDYAVLMVSDTGTGIPAESIEKIFEPFYTKKKMGRSGTGLGLAIVWGTVKDHSGYVDVQTEAGEGTTFTLYFPVTRDELTAQHQTEPIEQYMGNGESVLVVDDIAEQREIASRLIKRLGYEVHEVSCGEDAVEYLRENKTDILILDMIMTPGIDGLETYRRVLAINPKQKAVVVSGFTETDRAKDARKLGAGAYIKKPYVLEEIGVAIRDELARK